MAVASYRCGASSTALRGSRLGRAAIVRLRGGLLGHRARQYVQGRSDSVQLFVGQRIGDGFEAYRAHARKAVEHILAGIGYLAEDDPSVRWVGDALDISLGDQSIYHARCGGHPAHQVIGDVFHALGAAAQEVEGANLRHGHVEAREVVSVARPS